jgi:hypothetical protein
MTGNFLNEGMVESLREEMKSGRVGATAGPAWYADLQAGRCCRGCQGQPVFRMLDQLPTLARAVDRDVRPGAAVQDAASGIL